MEIKTKLQKLLNETNIIPIISPKDLITGTTLNIKDIKILNKKTSEYNNSFFIYNFKVNTPETNETNYVIITTKENKELFDCECTCQEYQYNNSCKHIGAVIFHYSSILFTSIPEKKEQNTIINAKQFLTKYKKEKTLKKEQIYLEVAIEKKQYYNYYNYGYEYYNIKLSIGTKNKKYQLSPKYNKFIKSYLNNEGEVKFGKEFTYNPQIHYLDDESDKILNNYIEIIDNTNNITSRKLKQFLKTLNQSPFIYQDYYIQEIKNNFPIKTKLNQSGENYQLLFNLKNITPIIKDDYEYIIYEGKMYHLTTSKISLLEELINNNIEQLEIQKEDISLFTEGLYSILKDNIEIAENINDIYLPEKINTEIYFDITEKAITAKVIFDYGKEKIKYQERNSNILRDTAYEENVINELYQIGFNEKLELKDEENTVYFLEKILEQLQEKYIIYTTEKLKKINIKKKTHITSNFSIGKDNILNYNFSLDGIDSQDLKNIFKSLKTKKKYYRLKNGDILSLEDQSLKELEQLSEELEFNDEDIIKGNGTILKYRAIYLDSLRKNKYSIIKTDNLFDKFIDNFSKYKEVDLNIKNNELSLLRDYQITGVKWLYTLAKTELGGILADEMGLGKTIQIIYYIKQILKDNKDNKILIVVPTALVYNWEHEFNHFAPEIKKVIYIGLKNKRLNIQKHLLQNNVIITTYGILREDKEYFTKQKFHTFIIDEAQNIKNANAGITRVVKNINAQIKFALTGTPIENSLLELWSIFDFIMPGYLPNIKKFQEKYRIMNFNSEEELILEKLNYQIRPFILRRKKEDVVKELPEKMINNIYLDLTEKQKQLYVQELENVKQKINEIIEKEGINKARFLILQLLMKLRQICDDPAIVYENYNEQSTKLSMIEEMVPEYINNGHKILIFSSFLGALDGIRKTLDDLNIPSFTITGSVNSKMRMELVENFNKKNKVKVFLIMLKAGGVGLNLTGADTVIHYDLWWNPQAENQATDRSHRIGQTKKVEVIHLITKGTIEEKIYNLQQKKQRLSDKVLDGEVRDKNLVSELTKEEMIELLSYNQQE